MSGRWKIRYYGNDEQTVSVNNPIHPYTYTLEENSVVRYSKEEANQKARSKATELAIYYRCHDKSRYLVGLEEEIRVNYGTICSKNSQKEADDWAEEYLEQLVNARYADLGIWYAEATVTKVAYFDKYGCERDRGSRVEYKVTKKAVSSSSVSMIDAEIDAYNSAVLACDDDIALNGQDYANKHGYCMLGISVVVEGFLSCSPDFGTQKYYGNDEISIYVNNPIHPYTYIYQENSFIGLNQDDANRRATKIATIKAYAYKSKPIKYFMVGLDEYLEIPAGAIHSYVSRDQVEVWTDEYLQLKINERYAEVGTWYASHTVTKVAYFDKYGCERDRGSRVEYRVTKTVIGTSSISIEDARNKAYTEAFLECNSDIATNGQDYANEHGYCMVGVPFIEEGFLSCLIDFVDACASADIEIKFTSDWELVLIPVIIDVLTYPVDIEIDTVCDAKNLGLTSSELVTSIYLSQTPALCSREFVTSIYLTEKKVVFAVSATTTVELTTACEATTVNLALVSMPVTIEMTTVCEACELGLTASELVTSVYLSQTPALCSRELITSVYLTT